MSRAPPSSAAARGLAFSWNQVVRGDPDASPSPPAASIPLSEPSDHSSSPSDSTATLRPPESDEHGSNGNAAAGASGKRQAWNLLAGGANEADPVMGAESWPALPESASRAAAKSSSSSPDGSSPLAPSGSVTASSQLKPSTNNANPSSTRNHDAVDHQKPYANPASMKNGDGASGISSDNDGPGAIQQPLILSEMPSMVDKGQESFPEELVNRGTGNPDQRRNIEFMAPLQIGGNHRRANNNGNRRGHNSGGTGGGAHHGRYGNRRDHERGGYGWNGPRGFGGRDPHMSMPLSPQWGQSQPFIRPSPPAAPPYISMPLHIQPFMSPMGYPGIPSPLYYLPPPPPPLESLRSMPLIAHQEPSVVPQTMLLSTADHQRILLMKQIEYYFSIDNLCKDIFLRRNMDDQGWVPISLIAGFNRVKQLTEDIQYILDAVRGSTVVEVQGDKIRRRDHWINWILPPTPNQYGLA